jgi:DNA-binding CsgD family transcriptional regulator
MAIVSNEENLVQDLWALGRTEDEIVTILGINTRMVHGYLVKGGYIDG